MGHDFWGHPGYIELLIHATFGSDLLAVGKILTSLDYKSMLFGVERKLQD